ncbi:hypothetical protein Ccrd_001758 [Cynara cardunculus var. scolymus]|uniref:Uncharacterized protein n=1 Tax=Cynara cardunculus var. scolymus TaxID=59895 RepID=A0A124SD87_CYNCS|nr:hypothetical protein Ccrd_001758 [Cynara cardunculus var. scolymus]
MCKMSERNEGFKDLNLVDNDPKVEVNDEPSTEEVPKHLEEVEDSPMPSPAQEGSQKSKGPLEALRPKLQVLDSFFRIDDGSPNLTATDDQGSELDSISDNKCRSEDENHPN